MTKTICDICGREVQPDKRKRLSESRDCLYNIIHLGTPIDLCVECRKSLYEWICKRKEENGTLKKED